MLRAMHTISSIRRLKQRCIEETHVVVGARHEHFECCFQLRLVEARERGAGVGRLKMSGRQAAVYKYMIVLYKINKLVTWTYLSSPDSDV